MIAVIQRCSKAKVSIRDTVVGEIGNGLLVLLGVEKNDSESDAEYLVKKITKLRIFNDKNAKMNLSLLDVKGSALVVSQFTLCGNTQKGRRPSFIHAASPKEANRLYIYFMEKLKEQKQTLMANIKSTAIEHLNKFKAGAPNGGSGNAD